MIDVLPQAVLRERFLRFWHDKKRGIQLSAFAEICGISKQLLRRVFVIKDMPMTERTQIAVSKALREWEEGKFVIEKTRRKYRESGLPVVVWPKEPKPTLKPAARLVFTGDGFQVKLAMQRRGDYSQPTLTQQMEKSRGR